MLELARDLDTPERRASLQASIRHLEGADRLASDPELAWRAYACALLAEAIGED